MSQVTAAAHDEWLARVDQDVVGGFDAGNELVLYFCDDGLDVEYGRFCNLCESAVACCSALAGCCILQKGGSVWTVCTTGA